MKFIHLLDSDLSPPSLEIPNGSFVFTHQMARCQVERIGESSGALKRREEDQEAVNSWESSEVIQSENCFGRTSVDQ